MKHYGLIGYPLSHSFSERYFTEKFSAAFIKATYKSIEVHDLEVLPELVEYYKLDGFNVTIPYKERIIPFLDSIDAIAAEIGAVNCVCVVNGKLKGYNTDVIGFEKSLMSLINSESLSALVIGSGGSSKAVAFVLNKLHIPFQIVSRNELLHSITYADLNEQSFHEHRLLINTTPVGMFPNVDEKLPIPYQFMHERNLAFDLIYNPEKTFFLKACESAGGQIKNGYDMLIMQAEASYELFTNL